MLTSPSRSGKKTFNTSFVLFSGEGLAVTKQKVSFHPKAKCALGAIGRMTIPAIPAECDQAI
jgi:hypothetical protein